MRAFCRGCWESAGWSDLRNFPPISPAPLGFPCNFSGSDGPGEELPEAYGVLHAANPAHCLEHPDGKRSLISFLGEGRGRPPPAGRLEPRASRSRGSACLECLLVVLECVMSPCSVCAKRLQILFLYSSSYLCEDRSQLHRGSGGPCGLRR